MKEGPVDETIYYSDDDRAVHQLLFPQSCNAANIITAVRVTPLNPCSVSIEVFCGILADSAAPLAVDVL